MNVMRAIALMHLDAWLGDRRASGSHKTLSASGERNRTLSLERIGAREARRWT